MKFLAILVFPLLCSSCALIQLPARLINAVIAPLTSTDGGSPSDESIGVALRH
jgi:hypothetical protein